MPLLHLREARSDEYRAEAFGRDDSHGSSGSIGAAGRGIHHLFDDVFESVPEHLQMQRRQVQGG